MQKKNVKIFISADNLQYKKIIDKVNPNKKIYTKQIEDSIYYQSFNKGLALETLKYLDIPFASFNKSPLGRFTILKTDPLLILDGCHNYDGAVKLSKQIKDIDNLIILFGSSERKDQIKILEVFKKIKKEIFLTEFIHKKSWKIDKNKFKEFKIIDNWEVFLDNNKDKNILVCGSLYFIPLVYKWFEVQ